jgi:hypothetical protein
MADFDLGSAKGRIEIDTSGLDKMDSAVDKTTRSMSDKFAAVGKKMSSVGKGMTVGITLPLLAFGKSAVSAFTQSQVVVTQTQAAIKSTVGAANVTSKQVGDLATKIEH